MNLKTEIAPGLFWGVVAARVRNVYSVLLLALVVTAALPTLGRAQDFLFTTEAGNITITGRTGLNPVVDIPSTIGGLPVTAIGVGAFSGSTGLTSITIANSVTTLGSGAFSRCTGLTSVTIPNSVTNIGGFEGCTGLTSVTIPNSVTTLETGAFSRCPGLTSVTIPDSVINIGGFDRCTGLTNVIIGNGVTTMGSDAFSRCTGLTSVTIPNSVANIYGFDGCTGLTNVIIGNGVTTLGSGAFSRCTALTSITIGNGVTNIDPGTFSNCAGLKRIYFGGNAPSGGVSIFDRSSIPTIFYLPGTTGWKTTFGLRTFAVWSLPNPVILTSRPDFGRQANGFSFIISWATNIPVVVEATTDLAQSVWSPVGTNTLNEGTAYFSDLQWTNHLARLYRVRSR